MKDLDISGLIKKANESLEAATLLLKSGSVNKETAAMLIDQAKEFIETVIEYLKNEGFEL